MEVLDTGRVWGDLRINTLLLNEGAYLRGQTIMHGDMEFPMIEAPRTATAATLGTIVDVRAKTPQEV